MSVLYVIFFLLIAGIASVPTLALRKRHCTTWWDYIYPFTGVIGWFALDVSGMGSTVSLSNFAVETFWIAVLSVAIPWIRWPLSKTDTRPIRALSAALTLLPIVAAAAIRLTTPSLPE